MSQRLPLGPLLLAAALAILVYGALVWWPIEADDAYITFRYAQNLLDGLGPVFNAGERVEGYSNPSWMLLMSAVLALGLDPVPTAKILGVASAAGLLLVLYRGLRRARVTGWGAGMAAMFVGSSIEVQVWSVGGLETLLYSLLFFAGLEQLVRSQGGATRALSASALLALAALTRPEGIAFWGAGLLVVAWRTRRDALPYLIPGAVLVLHIAWRYAYYGELLPNTYYTKVGEGTQMWAASLRDLRFFILHVGHLAWVALAAFGAVIGVRMCGQGRAVAIVAGAAACHFAYLLSVGGDGLGFSRFYVPLLAPLAFLLGMLHSERVSESRRTPFALVSTAGMLIAMAHSLWILNLDDLPGLNFESQSYKEGKQKLGRHLAENRPADTLIAVTAAGAIPFYSGLPTIDMYGLGDYHIARVPFAEGPWLAAHMKWDNAYVMRRRPDLIAINKGYFRKGDLAGLQAAEDPLVLAKTAMELDLFGRVMRDPEYHYRAIRFDDGSRYFVFERRLP